MSTRIFFNSWDKNSEPRYTDTFDGTKYTGIYTPQQILFSLYQGSTTTIMRHVNYLSPFIYNANCNLTPGYYTLFDLIYHYDPSPLMYSKGTGTMGGGALRLSSPP